MGDRGLSLLLILTTVVLEITAGHTKPFPWQSRHGFLSGSNILYPPPHQLRKTHPAPNKLDNPFNVQSSSRKKSVHTPFQSEPPNPVRSCVKKANEYTSPSRIRELILSLGEGAAKERSSSGADIYHQRSLRRSSGSQVHDIPFLLPFLAKLSSHFGGYLRKVLGCQTAHRNYVAQPKSSRITAPQVHPIDSISSSSFEPPETHASFVFERSAPQPQRQQIPLLPPPNFKSGLPGKTRLQEAHLPIHSRPSSILPSEQIDESTVGPFTRLSVSQSRAIQRSFPVGSPSGPGLEEFPSSEGTSSVPQPATSDSSIPQPFEDLPFSPPPVDMSGLPPPVFANSDSSPSSLPDVIPTISDSSIRLTPVDPSLSITSPGLQTHRVTEISLLPTTTDATGSLSVSSVPLTTLTLPSYASQTQHSPSIGTSSPSSTSRTSASSHPAQPPGSLYFGPTMTDVEVLVEARGVVGRWRITVPPMFGIIDLLRYLAREQAEPINLSTLDPYCFVLTRMVGLRIDGSHVWTTTVISRNQEVIFQDRCLPHSSMYVLPGYTVVFRYTEKPTSLDRLNI